MGNINYTVTQINEVLEKQLRGVYRGFLTITSPTVNSLTPANTWFPVQGVFTDDNIDNGFTTSSSGVITFTGSVPIVTLFNAVADCEVDNATTITFAIFKNGQLLVNSQTPFTFTNTSKISNVGITSFLPFANGDTVQVYAKADSNNISLEVVNLRLTLTEH